MTTTRYSLWACHRKPLFCQSRHIYLVPLLFVRLAMHWKIMRTYFFSKALSVPSWWADCNIAIQIKIERLSLVLSSSWLDRSTLRRVLLAVCEMGYQDSFVFIYIRKDCAFNLSFINLGKACLRFYNASNTLTFQQIIQQSKNQMKQQG